MAGWLPVPFLPAEEGERSAFAGCVLAKAERECDQQGERWSRQLSPEDSCPVERRAMCARWRAIESGHGWRQVASGGRSSRDLEESMVGGSGGGMDGHGGGADW